MWSVYVLKDQSDLGPYCLHHKQMTKQTSFNWTRNSIFPWYVKWRSRPSYVYMQSGQVLHYPTIRSPYCVYEAKKANSQTVGCKVCRLALVFAVHKMGNTAPDRRGTQTNIYFLFLHRTYLVGILWGTSNESSKFWCFHILTCCSTQ